MSERDRQLREFWLRICTSRDEARRLREQLDTSVFAGSLLRTIEELLAKAAGYARSLADGRVR